MFAPCTEYKFVNDCKFKFDLDMKRLNDEEKPLNPWVIDHKGRLGIVILADSINYSINYKNKDMYKFY
jgi:hypothetical protein